MFYKVQKRLFSGQSVYFFTVSYTCWTALISVGSNILKSHPEVVDLESTVQALKADGT